MSFVIPNKVVDVIDACTLLDSTGCYKIKPLTEIRKSGYDGNSFDNVVLWESKNHQIKRSGAVIFGSDMWTSNENTNRHLTMLGGDSEIAFQLKLYALIAHICGIYKGGSGEKLSTLQTKLAALKKFGKHLITKGLTSFHQLTKLNDLALRTLVTEYLSNIVQTTAPMNKPRVFADCFQARESFGLIDNRTAEIFEEVLSDLFKTIEETLSHPIIPTGISARIAKFSAHVVSECGNRIEEWELYNDKLLEFTRNWNQPIDEIKGADLFNRSAIKSGIISKLNELAEYFIDLKVAVYIHILQFTGMRYNEVLSCRIGCTNKSDPINAKYLIEAETHKTANTFVLDTWVCNKETFEAIKLLERYSVGMEARAELILERFRGVVQDSLVHNIEVGMTDRRLFGVVHSAASISFAKSGRFEDFEVKSEHFLPLFDLTLTEADIRELDRLEQNYKQIKGKDRGVPYTVGDTLRLANHMFRHSFAYFVIANKLGELDDIADQFKHLTLAMTHVYVDKGILSHEELIDLVDGYEQLLTTAIASELAEQASNNELKGGAGERFNKAAKELIIGVTNSNSPNAAVIRQIHFKDLGEFKRFLAKNIETIRGLPHGYCTAGDSCKISGASVPAGCVYCPSFIVADTHKPHWIALKNRALDKLKRISSLPIEKQKDMELFVVAYTKDLRAAEYVLNTIQDPTKSSGVSL
jgi:hypothetical protein